jgi:hypothetical protein
MRNSKYNQSIVAVIGFALTAPVIAQETYVEVSATGTGATVDAACKNALRAALEKGASAEIDVHRQSEHFTLIRETVNAHENELVADYKRLDTGDAAGGVKFCKVTAKIRISAVASAWAEVQGVLDRIGRPAIVVSIQERIDGRLQDSSILESQIEHRLLDAGFTVRAGAQVSAIANMETSDAASEENIVKIQAIAKDFGAQIFIIGTASADAAGLRDLYGQQTAMYNCEGMFKMYYTDTAEMLASESVPNLRGGARTHYTHSVQAGKKALENAGQELVDRCYNNVMERWAKRIAHGGEVVLEVQGASLADAIRIKKKLKGMDPDRIRRVDHSLTKGIATFRIQAKMTAIDLSELLVGDDWAALLEVVDLKTNRIQAKAMSK